MRLLVIGASGHLGSEVARLALAAGAEVTGTHARPDKPSELHDWSRLDVREPFAVHTLVQLVRPDAVINTCYDRWSWGPTATGAAHVATAAAAVGARLVHVSSDALHAGRPEAYTEDDDPSPITPYGAAKAAAETAVAAIDPSAAIVRTSLILGDETSPQVRLALDLIHRRSEGRLFTDQVRCPIDGAELAAALLELVGNDYAGVLNVAGPQAVSRAQLGKLIALRHGLSPRLVPTGKATRVPNAGPLDVKLDSSRAATLLKVQIRPVSEVLAG
ncbi:sugar nucleotide-binding protein [Hamadaea sp. NPDC051192]|uniref:sugar nucleotide-binding protein n=1 Tax=Hamadaea sp. NPDC051192 TaxID=3154940 RepID=UPI0034278D4C